jgi:hypothetical protein
VCNALHYALDIHRNILNRIIRFIGHDIKDALRTLISAKNLLLSIFLLSILFVLHSPNLNSWFIADDPQIIYCSQKPLPKFFFDKEAHYLYNTLFYAPLHPLYYKIDFLLFRLKPFGYHVVNVMALFLVSVILYRVFSLYIERPYAFLGAVVFSVLPPSTFDAGWITTRHYLLGLLFYLLSLWFFRRWEENKKNLYIGLAVFSGMLAFLSKELFVSLPLVVFIFARGGFKSRVKKAIPFVAALLVYLLWRIHMLEGIGGYPEGLSVARDVVRNFFTLFPNISGITLSLSILGLSTVFLFFIRPALAIGIVSLFLVALSPLIPVLPSGPVTHPVFIRGLLLPAIPLIYGFVYVVRLLIQKQKRIIQAAAVLVVAVLLVLEVTESRKVIDYLKGVADDTEKAYLTIKETHGSAIIVRNENDFLNLPLHYLYFLMKINEEYLKLHVPHITFVDNTVMRGFIPSSVHPEAFDEAYIFRDGILEKDDAKRLVRQKEHFRQSLALSAPQVQTYVSGYHIRVGIKKQCDYDGRNIFCINLYDNYTGCFELPDDFKVTLPPRRYSVNIFYRCGGKVSLPFVSDFDIEG